MPKQAPQVINTELIGVPVLSLELATRRLLALNQEARDFISAEEQPLSSLLAPEEERRLIALAERSLRSGLSLSIQEPFTRSQGSSVHQRFDLMISPYADGVLLLTCVDLYKWEARLEATRRNTEFLHRLIDLTSTLFFVVDRQRLVSFANEAFTRHCQLSDEEVKQLSPALVPQLEADFYEQLERCFQERHAQRAQLVWPQAQGERCVFQLMMQPLITQRGEADQVLVLGSSPKTSSP